MTNLTANYLDLAIQKMKNIIPNFEVREEQYKMMDSVYKAMKGDLKVGVHAPTGTGKSLGYLIPFVAVKAENPKFKITISTYTISLQEQLKKEIEMAFELYNVLKKELSKDKKVIPLRYEVLKGKTNYFCSNRFNDSFENLPESFLTEVQQKANELSLKNQRLDRQNFNMKINDDQWEEMNVDGCKNYKCEYRHKCTFFKHYYENDCDICIVNHALFFNREYFIDEAWDSFDFNVFDEGHKVEKVILEAATFELSVEKLEKWVYSGANIANRHNLEKEEVNDWLKKYLYKNETVNQFKESVKFINTKLEEIKTKESKGRKKIEAISIDFSELGYEQDNFIGTVIQIGFWQKEMYETFKNEIAKFDTLEDGSPLKEEVGNWGLNLLELGGFYRRLKTDNSVLWIDNNKEFVNFKATPGNIHSIRNPFVRGVLFTSGTLAEKGECQTFATRLNIKLDTDEVLPTPFDLKERTMFYYSKDCNPKDKNKNRYNDQLESELFELIKSGEMKTFALFTANNTMKEMYERLKTKIEMFALKNNERVEVWIQTPNNYNQVIESFKNLKVRTVLFGTLTYFEGIDLKGEQLTQVILAKLPYAVPNHPIQQILDKNHSYSKWEAVIRFEQAFGRLIRTKNDYGTFAVLDNRINNAYFKDFIEMFKSEGVPITNNISDVREFYAKMKK